MSPRRLAGWEPAEVTLYEYEGDRLVASVTVREAEFSPADVAAMLESRWRQSRPVGPHGQPIDEAMSADADPANQDGRYFYRAKGPRRDHAAAALERAKDIYFTNNPKAKNDQSLMWSVERVER